MDIHFAASEGPTLGVELELTIIDRESLDLVSSASEILAEIGGPHPGGKHPKAKNELFECTIEIITDVCRTAGEARADLESTLGEVRQAAGTRGLTLMSIGTHPFAGWRDQVVSPHPRYHELVEEMQWTARRLMIFGSHFHVGVKSGEKSIAIATALQADLPHFLILSASSPYWEREDSGLASSRIKVFESLPTAGLPPRLADWHEFEEFMETLIAAGCIKTIREVWWDIRPHPTFGTVELRMCDAIPTLSELASVAALAQCLVDSLDERFDNDTFPRPPREWTVRENKWLAARYGLDADLIVDSKGTRRPARELITELVERMEPIAERLGCTAELEGVLKILDHGPSYLRQRRILATGGSARDVVSSAVDELITGRPATHPSPTTLSP